MKKKNEVLSETIRELKRYKNPVEVCKKGIEMAREYENKDLDVSIAIVAVICDWLKETDGIENDLGLFSVAKLKGKIKIELV